MGESTVLASNKAVPILRLPPNIFAPYNRIVKKAYARFLILASVAGGANVSCGATAPHMAKKRAADSNNGAVMGQELELKGHAMSSTSTLATEHISLDALAGDPYPIYSRLRREQPVAWAPLLGMWLITRYNDVREVLLNTDGFVTGTQASLLFDTFGEHMLTSEGALHNRYRDPGLNGAFMPASIRTTARTHIEARVATLLDGFIADGRTDLRQSLAARLPVLTMLDVFGLGDDAELSFRAWYDAFEAALSNHGADLSVRARARDGVADFHKYFQAQIEACRDGDRPGLLHDFLTRPAEQILTDEEIQRNALIIFFGGISTVEAVILNILWALLNHRDAFERVRRDRSLLDAAFNETMRWISPVQSATRHTVKACEVGGVQIPAGMIVNCMLASANRDELVFDSADTFDIDRKNARNHLGFATGPHLCLGRHLAREEALIAINGLLDRTVNLRLGAPNSAPIGHEFRQPPVLWLEWD